MIDTIISLQKEKVSPGKSVIIPPDNFPAFSEAPPMFLRKFFADLENNDIGESR